MRGIKRERGREGGREGWREGRRVGGRETVSCLLARERALARESALARERNGEDREGASGLEGETEYSENLAYYQISRPTTKFTM